MTEKNSGRIVVAGIGIPEDAYRFVGPGDMYKYPIPESNSHKGRNGRLLIIAGGPYIGAPTMSGLSALKIGTDIVTVAAPEKIIDTVASFSPVFTFYPLCDDSGKCDMLRTSHVPGLLKESENYDAVLIGPGLGIDEDTISAVREFVASCRIPIVADADAINALENDGEVSVPIVYTPHKKEFEILGGTRVNERNVTKIAKALNGIVLLKGEQDIISDGEYTRLNRTGTPAMTGAGTGDVLSGIVAGLLSKGLSAFNAACLGAYICGLAGEYGFETNSYGMVATDVIDSIPSVLKDGLSKL